MSPITPQDSISCPVDLLMAIADRLQETQSLLQLALVRTTTATAQVVPMNQALPTIDTATLTVRSNGKSCFLGNTLPFWLFSRLIRRPNHYLSHATLMDEVWKGLRSPSSIRSVVRELRAKLRHAGMDEVANGIDGTVRGHYAYIHQSL